jgi:hypothetical protein
MTARLLDIGCEQITVAPAARPVGLTSSWRVAALGFMESPLIKHPLAQEAGGDAHHGGGQQFASQSDPDWLTLKAFVSGATRRSSSRQRSLLMNGLASRHGLRRADCR